MRRRRRRRWKKRRSEKKIRFEKKKKRRIDETEENTGPFWGRRRRRRRRRRGRRATLGEIYDSIVDRYYIRSHFPPRDVLTELGENAKENSKSKWPLVPLAIMALISAFCLFRDKQQ